MRRAGVAAEAAVLVAAVPRVVLLVVQWAAVASSEDVVVRSYAAETPQDNRP